MFMHLIELMAVFWCLQK